MQATNGITMILEVIKVQLLSNLGRLNGYILSDGLVSHTYLSAILKGE